MKTHHNRYGAQLICGFLLGAAIWWLSPKFTGEVEPWDGGGGYFPAALLLAGALSACVDPPRFWLGSIGVYAGQLGYMLAFIPVGSLMVLGIPMLAIFTLIALLGGALVYAAHKLATRSHSGP